MFGSSPPRRRLVSIVGRVCYLTLVGSASDNRTIPRFSEYSLELKVTVSSAGESYIKPYNLSVAVTCAGC